MHDDQDCSDGDIHRAVEGDRDNYRSSKSRSDPQAVVAASVTTASYFSLPVMCAVISRTFDDGNGSHALMWLIMA